MQETRGREGAWGLRGPRPRSQALRPLPAHSSLTPSRQIFQPDWSCRYCSTFSATASPICAARAASMASEPRAAVGSRAGCSEQRSHREQGKPRRGGARSEERGPGPAPGPLAPEWSGRRAGTAPFPDWSSLRAGSAPSQIGRETGRSCGFGSAFLGSTCVTSRGGGGGCLASSSLRYNRLDIRKGQRTGLFVCFSLRLTLKEMV